MRCSKPRLCSATPDQSAARGAASEALRAVTELKRRYGRHSRHACKLVDESPSKGLIDGRLHDRVRVYRADPGPSAAGFVDRQQGFVERHDFIVDFDGCDADKVVGRGLAVGEAGGGADGVNDERRVGKKLGGVDIWKENIGAVSEEHDAFVLRRRGEGEAVDRDHPAGVGPVGGLDGVGVSDQVPDGCGSGDPVVRGETAGISGCFADLGPGKFAEWCGALYFAVRGGVEALVAVNPHGAGRRGQWLALRRLEGSFGQQRWCTGGCRSPSRLEDRGQGGVFLLDMLNSASFRPNEVWRLGSREGQLVKNGPLEPTQKQHSNKHKAKAMAAHNPDQRDHNIPFGLVDNNVKELGACCNSTVADVEEKISGSTVILRMISRRIQGQVVKIINVLEKFVLRSFT
ncbi:eukaryotic aspartyl protease family protein [Actinidia rufa]|uniref:Eukaryotic aspartyl protease family protein n=1 Tax=Actinidia rufa TaxID=165716 RepID=A0A7J0EFK8_9ERIC|nr:eukaryotic aspartyl protease family protein [Actinidia rufa]